MKVKLRVWHDPLQRCDVADFTTEGLGRTHVYRWALAPDETAFAQRRGAVKGLREMVRFYRLAH